MKAFTPVVSYMEKIVSEDAGLYGRWIAHAARDEWVCVESFFGMFMVYVAVSHEALMVTLANQGRKPDWVEPHQQVWKFNRRLEMDHGLSRQQLFKAVAEFRHRTPAERRQLVAA